MSAACLTAAALSADGSLRVRRTAQVPRECRAARVHRATLRQQRCWRRLAEEPGTSSTGDDLGLIIECDGAIIDAHVDGHRVAFNRAFSEIGHDCTSWTPAVFYDLMRLGDSTGEGLIATYYSIAGWPMMLASSDRAAFLKKVHALKVHILREMTAKGEVPLRNGATEFLDDALREGAKVAVVAATASVPEDGLVSSAMLNLGPSRAFRLRVVSMGSGSNTTAVGGEGSKGTAALLSGGSAGEGSNELYGASFEAQVAAAQAKAKSQAAQEFVRVYNLQRAEGMGVHVDPKMMSAAERAGLITPQFMAALAATLGSRTRNTIVVGGGHTILEAGKSAGMLTLGVPPSVAMRGGFSAADAVFDGYGAGGGLTWQKAKLLLNKKQQADSSA